MPLLRLSALFLGLLGLPLLLVGCELFSEEDTVIRASGTVVLGGTGEPIEGITVALDEILGISHVYIKTVRTDAEGRFSLIYDNQGKNFTYRIVINANPPLPNYTGRGFRILPGEPRDFGVIELSRIGD